MKRLLLASVLGACDSHSSSPPTTPPPPPDITVIGADPGEDTLREIDAAIKPEATAGLYWLPYVTCHDCEPPTAIVAYITPDEATARAIVAAMQGKLRLGLPYVVHTDEIGASPRGIAVVTGSFDERAYAEHAAAGSDAIAGISPAVVDIDKDYWKEAPRHVTVIDRGGPTPAWSAADLHAVEQTMSESSDPEAQNTLESQRRWMQTELAARKPACTVNAGDLFVVEDSELEWYSFAPVRCGKTLAYVPWTRSLLGHAVIVMGTSGRHEL
ncbi:MAG TPA: hypothetical protein VM261_07985, partial [Kofleriaceae bacterium]|nr:hypothetical protein [Kofleriaceae bacterium]